MSLSVAHAETAWFAPNREQAEQQKGDAVRALMKEGSEAYARRDWEAARKAYVLAWQLKPNPLIAANLGDVEIKLERYREAAEHVQYFLFHAPFGVKRDKLAGAEQQLAECRKHVASVTITSNLQGAEVRIGDRVIGRTPLLGQTFLDPGTYVIDVKLADYAPASKSIIAESGTELIVNFNLEKSVKPNVMTSSITKEPPKPKPPDRAGTSPRTWVVAGGAVATGISLGIGVVFRIRAGNFDSDVNATTAQLDAPTMSKPSEVAAHSECLHQTTAAKPLCDALHAALEKRDTAANISTGAFVSAGVLGAATVFSLFLWPEAPKVRSQSANVPFAIRPLLTGSGSGVQLFGSF